MKRRTYIILALLALLAWGVIHILREDFQSGPNIGSLAPDFQLKDLNGQTVSLSDFRGKAVLVNFWASWCGPCREEMPSLEVLYQRFKNRGLVVLGVSADDEGWEPIKQFLKIIPVSFPILLDQDQNVTSRYETFRIPETYFIDPEGRVAGKVVGPHNYNQEVFFKKVERILPKD